MLGPFLSHKGLPQGCDLPPSFYNLCTLKINNNLTEDCNALYFADDIALFTTSPNLSTCLSTLETNLSKVAAHLHSLGLSISPEKTQLIIFSRKSTKISNASIHFNNSTISAVPRAKLLGITLDSRLSWTPHLQSLLRKCTPHTNIIRSLSLCSTKWGCHPQCLLQIYKAFILGSIDYGSTSLLPSSRTMLDKVDILQRRALRTALGLRSSTPNRIVYAETCELPLSFQPPSISNNPPISALKLLADSVDSRNRHNVLELPVLRAFIKLKHHQNRIFSSPVLPCFTYSLDSQIHRPNIILEKGREIKKSPAPPHLFFQLFRDELTSFTAFYTDGSKTCEGSYVSLAVYSPAPLNLSLLCRISSSATIFTAEALAIQLALEYILFNNIDNSIIFTDSLSTLQAIDNLSDYLHSSSPSIFKIKHLLFQLHSANRSVFLAWIPSHVGIPGNEKADFLANEAAKSGSLLNFSLPSTDLLSSVYNSFIKPEFNRFLNNYRQNTGTLYFSSYFSPSTSPWFCNMGLDRREITTFSRMRSNHVNLNASLHRINLADSPLCSCNSDSEDLNHIFWSCQLYDLQRPQLLQDLANLDLFPPFSITSFLSQPTPNLIKILLRFLTSCDLSI